MREELMFEEARAEAAVRLAGGGWAQYLQTSCARLKSAGRRERADGVHALVGRLKRARPSTYGHCLRVARYSKAVGRTLGFDERGLRQLASTAMLHDIGKILVPESILNRPRRLTRAERFVLRLHPTFGALLAVYYDLSAELRVRTEHHHERWDGRGYPHRLGGEDIPLMARVVQVTDSFDAMVERRPYNTPRTVAEAVSELRRESGKQFDPRMVEAFLDTLSDGR